MRQFVYASTSKIGFSRGKLQAILDTSRRHNGKVGITGLLWTDGKRFAQILEGRDTAIEELMQRIRIDPHHIDIIVLTDRQIDRRDFGDWSMALRDESGAQIEFNARVRDGLTRAPAAIRDDFAKLGDDR